MNHTKVLTVVVLYQKAKQKQVSNHSRSATAREASPSADQPSPPTRPLAHAPTRRHLPLVAGDCSVLGCSACSFRWLVPCPVSPRPRAIAVVAASFSGAGIMSCPRGRGGCPATRSGRPRRRSDADGAPTLDGVRIVQLCFSGSNPGSWNFSGRLAMDTHGDQRYRSSLFPFCRRRR